jgi:hypothetical protein
MQGFDEFQNPFNFQMQIQIYFALLSNLKGWGGGMCDFFVPTFEDSFVITFENVDRAGG